MTFQPPYRPSGRSVWLGKDLVRTDDWIIRLSPATLEEIDAAVSRLRRRNAYDAPVAREEFPLATMTDDLARMRHEPAHREVVETDNVVIEAECRRFERRLEFWTARLRDAEARWS